jgi:hypothetical protein
MILNKINKERIPHSRSQEGKLELPASLLTGIVSTTKRSSPP